MRWGLAAAVEAGQWACVDDDVTADVSPTRVNSVGTAPRTIGCVDGDYTVHHIALGDGVATACRNGRVSTP